MNQPRQLELFARLYDLALWRRGITIAIGSGRKALVVTLPFMERRK